MAYTPSSPEEQAYIQDFNAHDQAIWDYHQRTGKSLEDSYQAVTGKPWMEGRSIKFVGGTKGNTGNGFEMTKDRTFKSVLGKYVAPIAGGALTALTLGGAAPSLAGLFGGGSAAAEGGGVVGGGLGTGALAAGATVPGTGVAGGIGAGLTAAGTAATTGSRIANLLQNPALSTIGSGLADYATQGAQNRQAEQEASVTGPAADAAALKNMLRSSYVANGGFKPSPTPQVTPAGTLPTFDFAPKGSTPEQQAFAKQMQDELLKRIQSGRALTLSGIAPAGTGERLAGTIAPILGIGSQIANLIR